MMSRIYPGSKKSRGKQVSFALFRVSHSFLITECPPVLWKPYLHWTRFGSTGSGDLGGFALISHPASKPQHLPTVPSNQNIVISELRGTTAVSLSVHPAWRWPQWEDGCIWTRAEAEISFIPPVKSEGLCNRLLISSPPDLRSPIPFQAVDETFLFPAPLCVRE